VLREDDKGVADNVTPTRAKAAHLRLRRRGERLLFSVSPDGVKWEPHLTVQRAAGLPRRVKVGVLANTVTDSSCFVATFDNLKFTQHRGKP
jgi:regulation of enolase protein 1 (concanavalin A-like superfamily)